MNGITVSIVGNATRDPELKYTPNGQAVAKFGVAVSRRYQTNGKWGEQTSFVEVVAWGQLAENVAETVKRGTRVIVSGRHDQRTYEVDGQKRTVWDLTADEVGPSLRWATAVVTKAEREGGPTTPVPAGNEL